MSGGYAWAIGAITQIREIDCLQFGHYNGVGYSTPNFSKRFSYMTSHSRKWIVPLGMALTVSVAYGISNKQQEYLNPVQQVEALIAPCDLKFCVETNTQSSFVVPPDQFDILVRQRWSRVEIGENDGASINGITTWEISVLGWRPGLQEALLNALNDSSVTADQLIEHPDDRIQFLLLHVLADWGHNVSSFVDAKDPSITKLWNLKPHAVESLLSLAHRKDPHAVGTVISALQGQGTFSTDVFLAAMAHPSTNIRAEALRWLSPAKQHLTGTEIQEIAPVLIGHLTDQDMVVRQWSMGGLQELVAHWEQSLGGAPVDVVRTHQEKMIKLPVAPASSDWYHNVYPQSFELAKDYQAEWQAWLTAAEQSL